MQHPVRRKFYPVWLSYQYLARIYELTPVQQYELSQVLNEPVCDDFDFGGIMDRENRLLSVFGVSTDEEKEVFYKAHSQCFDMAKEFVREQMN